MTDARLPERYLTDRRILKLTANDRAAYFMSLLWCVANRTDGRLDADDLPLIPTYAAETTDALVSAGLWSATDSGWIVVDFEGTQTSRSDLEVLERARRADREKKRRHRAASPGRVPGTSPGRVPGTAQERTGEAHTPPKGGVPTSPPCGACGKPPLEQDRRYCENGHQMERSF